MATMFHFPEDFYSRSLNVHCSKDEFAPYPSFLDRVKHLILVVVKPEGLDLLVICLLTDFNHSVRYNRHVHMAQSNNVNLGILRGRAHSKARN